MNENFEMIKSSVLEDPCLTANEFRILLYLTAKPADWQVRESQIARAVNMTPNAIKYALVGLRKKKYVIKSRTHRVNGQLTQDGSKLDKSRVLHLRWKKQR
jgi:DNA-binding MarR family transcriptional regulator